jgi:hypothetical protein
METIGATIDGPREIGGQRGEHFVRAVAEVLGDADVLLRRVEILVTGGALDLRGSFARIARHVMPRGAEIVECDRDVGGALTSGTLRREIPNCCSSLRCVMKHGAHPDRMQNSPRCSGL